MHGSSAFKQCETHKVSLQIKALKPAFNFKYQDRSVWDAWLATPQVLQLEFFRGRGNKMKSRTNFKKRLISVAIASVLTGLGSHAAANDFTIQNGALTISNGAFNQAVTVGVNGVIPSVTGVPLADSFGIPNFTFNLVNEADVKTNGTYAFKVGVVIDDDNSDRRIEAYLGTLNMTVSNSGNTLTGSIPAQN
ncbi:MAG: hypothetical protein Q8L06_07950, partial [Pseudohongiella sp.]|nr:hypothetical protein [Pseudohongiella sp.]